MPEIVSFIILKADGSLRRHGKIERKLLNSVPLKPGETIAEGVPDLTQVLTKQTEVSEVNTLDERRFSLMRSTDWTQLQDERLAMGARAAKAWDVYRQALRDIEKQPGFPDTIIWPTAPS